MATLVVLSEGREIAYELNEGQNVIGRHPDSPIPISHPATSGLHAVIHAEGGDCTLEDRGSRNGTFVNQQQIAGRVKLKHNDAIRFGQTNARFLDPAAAQAATGGSMRATVSDFQGKGTLDFSRIQISEEDSNITGQLAGTGRFEGLDVNPQAKLKAILEISNSLAGTLDLASLLPKIIDSLFGIFSYADRGCILLKDARTGEMAPRAMRHRREDEDSSVRLSRTILAKVLKEKAGILSADVSSDAAFSGSQSIADLKIRSMMCVPLLRLDGEVMGILSIDSQHPLGRFSRDDLDILMTVAGQAALAYENARLIEAYADKQKQDTELEIARNVQRDLLPTELPRVEGYQFFASYDAARAIGGDMYDCFEWADGKLCLSFGDVAGKGVPGAMIMSRMSSCVQSTVRHVHDVVEAITAINEHMCDGKILGRFVTYVLCMLDTRSHEVVLSNAGPTHVPVGRDQKQHLEMTRDIAVKFNQAYGETFVVPEPVIRDAVAVVPGLDGQKMSKSYNNAVEIFGEEKAIKKKVMSIVMDSRSPQEPKPDAEQNVAIQLLKLVAPAPFASETEARLRTGGLGYGELKKSLFEHLWLSFAEARKKRAELAANLDYVEHVLTQGRDRARAVASGVLQRARRASGIE